MQFVWIDIINSTCRKHLSDGREIEIIVAWGEVSTYEWPWHYWPILALGATDWRRPRRRLEGRHLQSECNVDPRHMSHGSTILQVTKADQMCQHLTLRRSSFAVRMHGCAMLTSETCPMGPTFCNRQVTKAEQVCQPLGSSGRLSQLFLQFAQLRKFYIIYNSEDTIVSPLNWRTQGS